MRALLLLPFILKVRPSNTLSLASPSRSRNPLIACASTTEVLRSIDAFVKPSHSVLEVGAQLTDVTEKIRSVCAVYSGIDVERKAPRRKTIHNASYRNTKDGGNHFIEVPNLSDALPAVIDRDFDVVILDLSHMTGMDLPLDTLSFISAISDPSLSSPVIIVKSKQLSRLGSRLHHARRLIDGRLSLSLPPPPLAEGEDGVYSRENECDIVAAVGVGEYRETIPRVVGPSDVVLEVGCHHGTTTRALDVAASRAIGVDVGKGVVETARRQAPGVRFEVGNAWSPAGLLRLLDGDAVDIVYLDVGGLSGSDGALEALALVRSLSNTLEPRCIVIKSKCLRDLSRDLIPFWEVWEKIR